MNTGRGETMHQHVSESAPRAPSAGFDTFHSPERTYVKNNSLEEPCDSLVFPTLIARIIPQYHTTKSEPIFWHFHHTTIPF
jgi:hypothetical protein